MRSWLIAVVFIAAPAVIGQTPTVDNFTLDKFKQQRLSAEKDLRENYAKLGFPSPEEMERRRRQDAEENAELLDKLREERLERERIDLERQRLAAEAAQYQGSQPVIIDGGPDYPYLPYVYDPYNGRGRFGRRHRSVNPYKGYRVTPVGIFGQGPQRQRSVIRHGPIRTRRH